MYAYFNDTTGELIAFMPRRGSRERLAKNHLVVNICGAKLSASLVPADKVADFSSAAGVKDYVTKHGASTMTDNAPTPHAVLHKVLYAMGAVLSDSSFNHPGSKVVQTVETLISDWDAIASFEDPATMAERLTTWCIEAGKAIDSLLSTVNLIMLDRGYGWFYTFSYTTPAPVDKTEKVEEDEVSYGFARMAGKETTNDEHGVFYPRPDKTYIINKQVEGLFKILETSSKKCPQNVNLIGPHGCGKTELAIQFAARLNRPLLIMDCANLREARDWFGYKTAKEGTVYWHESQFVRAIQAGNHVILLDELNRANPNLLNTLMPILDARRFTYLEERGDKIVVGPETVFFASMNEGAGYTGTTSLDRAIRDRFPRAVELTYLGENDEIKLVMNRTSIDKDIATRLVQMANKIRQDATGLSATLTESMSTRQLLAAAHDFALGGVDTLQFTITNHFSPDGDEDSERIKVQSLIQGKFGDLMAAQAAAANTGA